MKLREILYAIAGVALMSCGFYLAGALSQASFNLNEWTAGAREVVGQLCGWTVCAAAVILLKRGL